MTQYMISVIHAEEGPDFAEDVDIQEVYGKVDAFNKELQESGSWVFAGGLEPPSVATVVDATGSDDPGDRRPLRRDQGAARWLLGRGGTRPRRSPGDRQEGLGRVHGGRRGPPVPVPSEPPRAAGRRGRGHRGRARGRLPRRARPGGGQPGSPLRRPGPGRGRHRRGAGGRRRALARRGSAAQPGRLADHGGGQQGARPDPPREAAPGQVRGGVPHGHRRRPGRAHRPGRGRPAAAGVHLLPPRPRAGEPRGSHAEAARRADRGGDRRRLLRARDDDGAADHPLEAEDQGRATSPTGSRGPRTCPSG